MRARDNLIKKYISFQERIEEKEKYIFTFKYQVKQKGIAA